MQLHYGLDDLQKIDWMAVLPIVLPVVAIVILLNAIALIDLYRHRETRQHLLIWVLIILGINPLGAIIYFIIGRKDRVSP